MTAPILRTQADIVQAYRDRIRELGITYATVDAISGLPDGYCAKLMSPNPMKGLGEKAIEGLNGALGMGFAVTVDAEQVAKVQARWVKRRRAIDKKKEALLVSALSIENEVPRLLEITPGLEIEIQRRERMRMLGQMGGKIGGSKGGKKRAKNMKKAARQRAAAHAARTRWARRATACAP